MTAHARLGELLWRRAHITSIVRTRNEDAERQARHDAVNGEVEKRVASVVARLEKATADLEKLVA